MDLRIAGRTALVCAASKGLGKACAMALAGEDVNLVVNARTPGTQEAAAEKAGQSLDDYVAARKQANSAGRFGNPAEFGHACT